MRPLAGAPLAELDVDTGTRPGAPHLPEATEAHRRKGRLLKHIHRHYLQNFGVIAEVLAGIEAGSERPEALGAALEAAPPLRNMRQFGTLCGQQCQLLEMHHNAEEAMIFPPLAEVDNPALGALVERLRAEHLVVHELIHRLEEAAAALVQDPAPARLDTAREVFQRLRQVVGSHFGYEEAELEAALGLYVGEF